MNDGAVENPPQSLNLKRSEPALTPSPEISTAENNPYEVIVNRDELN